MSMPLKSLFYTRYFKRMRIFPFDRAACKPLWMLRRVQLVCSLAVCWGSHMILDLIENKQETAPKKTTEQTGESSCQSN